MSFNGSGAFIINSSGQPVVADTLIQAAVFNAFTADVATGLSTCITKDGQTTTTSVIPFASGISLKGSSVTDAAITLLAQATKPLMRSVGLNINIVDVKDYGAVGNGTANDTDAIVAAIAAAPTGSTILFPTGTYNFTSFTVDKSLVFRGASRVGTALRSTSATGNNIAITATDVVIENMTVTSSVTKTAGALINFQTGAHNGAVRNVKMSNYFGGIRIESLGVLLENVFGTDATPAATQAGSYHVWCSTNHLDNIWIINSSWANSPSTPSTYGVRLSRGASFFISNSDCRGAHFGMVVDPGTDEICGNINVNNCFFDTNRVGVYIAPSDNGIVVNVRMTNCWTSGSKDISSGAQGVLIDAAGGWSGSIDGIHLVNHNATNNTAAGVQFNDGSNLSIIGGDFAENGGSGVTVAANRNDFRIIGACLGSGGLYAGNAGYGVEITAGTSTRYVVTGNDVTGNTTGSILDGGTGAVKFVHSNTGYNRAPLLGLAKLTKSADYAITAADVRDGQLYVEVSTSGGNVKIDLPPPSTTFYDITILKTSGSNTLTVDTPGSEVILEAGAANDSITLTTIYQKVVLKSLLNNWAVVSRLA